MKITCVFQALVDRHMAAHGSPADEARMRAHLLGCAECRAYYDRHLLLARLDPYAMAAEERMARGLALSRSKRLRPWVLAGSLVAAAGFALIAARPSNRTGEMQARGTVTHDDAPRLFIYRAEGDRLVPVVQRMARGDELVFAYRNPHGKKYVMVYGIDEGRRVYWFHPQWTNAQEDPHAVLAHPGSEPTRLLEAIRHPIEGRVLRIHASFLDRSVSVKEAERELEDHGIIKDAETVSTTLEVQ